MTFPHKFARGEGIALLAWRGWRLVLGACNVRGKDRKGKCQDGKAQSRAHHLLH
jgi:hypothetical protein